MASVGRPQPAVDETGLTPGERKVFDFIYATARDRAYLPGFRETMNHFGWFSTNAVTRYIVTLVEKGWLSPGPRHTLLKKPDGSAFTGFKD